MKISLATYNIPYQQNLIIGTTDEGVVWMDWFEA